MTAFYYDQDNKIYSSKTDAILSGKNINLYFYDKEFSKVNWKIEPTETLEQLYYERARQIRDEYDYLILAYSGGVDSTNILESFYYNNLHLDEILVVGAFSQDSFKGSDENHNGEIYKNVFPTLNQYDLKNTKITVKDYTETFYTPEILSVYNSEYEKQKRLSNWYSFHQWWWADLDKFMDISKKDIKIGIIFGVDKPYISKINEQIVTYFIDKIIFQYGYYNNYNEENNIKRIFFYWHPQSEKILRKQLHILKHFVKANYNLNENSTGKIIYKLKVPLNFVSSKSKTNIISVRDKYIVKKQNSLIFENYKKHLVYANRFNINFKSRNYVIE